MRSHRLGWTLRGVGQCLLAAPWIVLLCVTLASFGALIVCWSVLDQAVDALRRGRQAIEWRLFVRRRVRAEIERSATGRRIRYPARRSTKQHP